MLITLAAPAIPDIGLELGVSTVSASWVITAYLLSASVTTPILGRLSDIYGRRRMFLVTLSALAVGTTGAALANSIEVLIACRIIQGLGGGLYPISFGIIRDTLPVERVPAGLGLVSGMLGIGSGSGIVMSGLTTDLISYRWAFWVTLIPILAGLIGGYRLIPDAGRRARTAVGWLAASMFGSGLALLLLSVTYAATRGWTATMTIVLAAGGLALIAIWIVYEIHSRSPLVGMALMRRRGVWTANLAGMLIGFGNYGATFVVPQIGRAPIAGSGFGLDPIPASFILLPMSALMMVAAASWGSIHRRFGYRRPLVAGTAISAAACLQMSLFHSSPAVLAIWCALLGIGVGVSFAGMANAVVAAVASEETGVATGINTIVRTVGGAFGGQVCAATLVANTGVDGLTTNMAFVIAFALPAIALTLAGLVALATPKERRAG